MEAGTRIYLPVSVAEMRISKRFDTIPSGTLHPNADEIEYLQRLVKYKACGQLIHKLSLVVLFGRADVFFLFFCFVITLCSININKCQ